MTMFKFGAPTPQVPSDGKIQDVVEVQTDGKGTITASKVTEVQPQVPSSPHEDD